MILKNWLSNTRIGFLFVVGGMDDFFTIKEDMFDDYEDELEEVPIFGTWLPFFCVYFFEGYT